MIVTSFIGICVLLYVGHFLRSNVGLLRKLYLPSSVVAGLLGLLAIQLLGRYVCSGEAFVADWTAGWSELPGFLINIVFACLLLGKTLPRIKTIWRHAAPQLAYGQIVAWGQYVVGIGLFLAVITYFWPELPTMFAGVLPVGFEGGHGTAAGLGQVFEEFNWAAGEHYAITSATAGILGAVIVGMALVNWAARKGYVVYKDAIKDTTPGKDGPSAGKLTVSSDAIDAISFHLTIIGIAMAIGWGIKLGLAQLGAVGGNETFAKIMDRFPLFPLCMIGGLIIQKLADKFDRKKLIDAGLTNRLQNLAMDFLVVAAIATINVKVVEKGIVPLLLLVCAGLAWNVLCVVVLARWMLPDAWFERSIAEMGQSMGVTATGLLLLRVVDPDYETPAADAFAYKQILHEPFMGGGLWTAAAIPFLAIWGGWRVLAIAVGAVVFWIIAGWVMKTKLRRDA
jgi:ESS family glutamate:Na+ symporter